jgi:tRNA dimethylallyltransferase
MIVGPTAVGKTDFAIQVAEHFQTEILSADSRQCYKEMNIGVAKPTSEELARVPHHFISSHSINQEVTAATYERFALALLEDLFHRHEVVVAVGGTGLFVRALCVGLDEVPKVAPELRESIVKDFNEKGLEWLEGRLREEDPLFAKEGEMQNPRRMMRALEVVRSSGRSILTYHSGIPQPRPFRIVKWGLELPREVLEQRIFARVDKMFQSGLLEEARELLKYRDLPAVQTIGYRELFDYFEGLCSLEAAVEKVKIHTRQYAKRQMTWFRKEPSVSWMDAQNPDLMTLGLKYL